MMNTSSRRALLLLHLFSATLVSVRLQEFSVNEVFLSNLDDECMRCLCIAATNCNLTVGCIQGYCGPYKIGRIYWADAGKVTLPEDDFTRAGAYEDCSINYNCAQKLVKNYLIKYAQDCNGDGRVNCHDFSMINFNGGYQCQPPLDRNEAGKLWLQRFYSCYPQNS